MIRENKFPQYGFPREKSEIQGICLHETGVYDLNAQQYCDFLDYENKSSEGCHYIVDKDEVVQVMPDDWSVYHTGKGIDWGCKHTIAIQLTSYFADHDYYSAEDRAVKLIKQLQRAYHIPDDMLFFHNDFDQKSHCPNRILNEYGSTKTFVYQRLKED